MLTLKTALVGFLVAVRTFLGPVAGSVAGFLTPAELSRAFYAGLGGSGLVGFAIGFLSTIAVDAQVSPTGGIGLALLAFVAVQVADQLRRVNHGSPAVSPSSASVPDPVANLGPLGPSSLLADWRKIHQGPGNAGNIGILEGGMKVSADPASIEVPKPGGDPRPAEALKPAEVATLVSRTMSAEEIDRLYGFKTLPVDDQVDTVHRA